MTKYDEGSRRIEHEKLESYRARRRAEAFDALTSEELELVKSLSCEQRAQFADGNDLTRRQILRAASKQRDMAATDYVASEEKPRIHHEDYFRGYRKAGGMPTASSAALLVLIAGLAFVVYALRRHDSPVGGKGNEYVDPLYVAREVERRLDRVYRDACDKAARTGDPDDVRRMNSLMKEWQAAFSNKNRLEWEASRR